MMRNTRLVYWSKYLDCYYPGDYARKDEDGYLWLLGRADDVLKVAGHRIGTAELESCIVSHNDVAESAVCGIPDEVKGEVIIAFVVLKHNVIITDNDDFRKTTLLFPKSGMILEQLRLLSTFILFQNFQKHVAEK